MKTMATEKPKLRGKAAKIAYLRRSAAGKAIHHRRRLKRHAKIHILVVAAGCLLFVSATTALALRLQNLVPPPGNAAEVDAYIRAAQAQNQFRRAPVQIGAASWYALGLQSPDALTCASRTFSRGTLLRVRDLRTGNEVDCLVNDYGPAAGTNRVIDLSRGSYRALEDLGSGTMPVEIRVAPGR